jgi:adenine phosphoribosyltransferase
MSDLQERVKKTVREVVDFPKPGIVFKDITPVLKDARMCSEIVDELAAKLYHGGVKNLHAIAGAESRGFFFGFLLANKLQLPFIPIRKPGKLPFKTVSIEYDLEYGSSKIEMNEDAIQPGWNVLIHDDLLATGGTAAATAELIKRQGGNIAGFCFAFGLRSLKGDEKLKPYSENIINLVDYE